MKIDKILQDIKVKHAEIADEIEVSVNAVRSYRNFSPKKLDLMIDGLRYRKLVKILREKELEDEKKSNIKRAV